MEKDASRINELLEQGKIHWEKEEFDKCLDDLDEAFEVGYVPGSEERWDITLVGFLHMFFHPDNKVALCALYRHAEEKEGRTIPDSEYEKVPGIENVRLRVTENSDMASRRRLDYQNQDKNYWLDWSRELRKYVV